MDAKTFLCCIEAIKSSDIAVQEDAANAVAALTEKHWLPQILHHLDDPNPLVRRVMLWTLRNYIGQISYPQFLAYLHDPDMAVREAALLLFMEGGSPACDALVAAVSSEEEELRFSAVQALGQFRTPEAIVPLMHAAGAKNPDIREVAVLSLGVYADACVVPQLLAALADEPQIRLAALEGLRGRELSPEDLVKISGCLYDAEYPEIRAAAVAVLGPLVPEEIAADASSQVRRAVASAAASPELLAHLCTDADASVRMAAAEAIGKQGYIMEDVLLPLFSDAVPGVRRAAVTALASSRRPDVVAALINCLHDPKPGIQAAAATALGEIGGDEVIAALTEASKSGNAILRGIMKNALNAALKK
ncbi:HEAT repeat domain-containing protein [Methanocorpusculum sp. MG]|uniref:HEAT repeat domain-containing protein n=1 Tax=Methanocorpusculum petauri TaxID=3002863 RepID=A0ABT4IGK7_9EURY|nr:HEAT repeat domain-containing protein [Methanocorpusculum petauri]MCZ0860871.1 HEAT repeat domain-containing protein [Methanocorpusculum petauri]MDE2444029.1 HEAT repeat domain-containing protein [Methanocorpusculum sp.]